MLKKNIISLAGLILLFSCKTVAYKNPHRDQDFLGGISNNSMLISETYRGEKVPVIIVNHNNSSNKNMIFYRICSKKTGVCQEHFTLSKKTQLLGLEEGEYKLSTVQCSSDREPSESSCSKSIDFNLTQEPYTKSQYYSLFKARNTLLSFIDIQSIQFYNLAKKHSLELDQCESNFNDQEAEIYQLYVENLRLLLAKGRYIFCHEWAAKYKNINSESLLQSSELPKEGLYFNLTSFPTSESVSNPYKVTLVNYYSDAPSPLWDTKTGKFSWKNVGKRILGKRLGHSVLMIEKDGNVVEIISYPESDDIGTRASKNFESSKSFYVSEQSYSRFSEWYNASEFKFKGSDPIQQADLDRRLVGGQMMADLELPDMKESGLLSYLDERTKARKKHLLKNDGTPFNYKKMPPGYEKLPVANSFDNRRSYVLDSLSDYDRYSTELEELKRGLKDKRIDGDFSQLKFEEKLTEIKKFGSLETNEMSKWFRDITKNYTDLSSLNYENEWRKTEAFKQSSYSTYYNVKNKLAGSIGLGEEVLSSWLNSNFDGMRKFKFNVDDPLFNLTIDEIMKKSPRLQKLDGPNWHSNWKGSKKYLLAREDLAENFSDFVKFRSKPDFYSILLTERRAFHRFEHSLKSATIYYKAHSSFKAKYGANFNKWGKGCACIDVTVESIRKLTGDPNFYRKSLFGNLPRDPHTGISKVDDKLNGFSNLGRAGSALGVVALMSSLIYGSIETHQKYSLTEKKELNPRELCIAQSQESFREKSILILKESEKAYSLNTGLTDLVLD